MKHPRILFACSALLLALMACQGLAGGNNAPNNSQAISTEPVVGLDITPVTPNTNNGVTVNSKFPMVSDAYNVITSDSDTLYYTRMSLEEVMKFYRDTYTAKGYQERESLTTVNNGTFSMVFDGDPSGKAIVIQSVDLGDGSRTVAIRLGDQ